MESVDASPGEQGGLQLNFASPPLSLPGFDEKVPLDQTTQTRLLEMWWSLVQDQVGSLNREIESLRLANSQIQARLADVVARRTEPATESMKALIAAEVARFKAELQTEKEERGTILERVQAELQRHSDAIEKHLRDDRAELRGVLAEELRGDVLQNLVPLGEVAQDVASLKRTLEQEASSRAEEEQRLAESVRRLTADFDKERQSQSSNHGTLQSQIQSLSKDIETEREEWAQRRGNLLGKILQHISDQDHNFKQERQLREQQAEQQKAELKLLVADSCTKERQLREQQAEQQKAELKLLVAEGCTKDREQTRAMLARARQILDTDDAMRAKLERLLHTEMVSKAEFTSEAQHLWQAIKSDPSGGAVVPVPVWTSTPPRQPQRPPSLRSPRSPAGLEAPVVYTTAVEGGSRGGSPVRAPSIPMPGQPVKVVSYRSASWNDMQSTVDLHCSGGSSAATLPPPEDTLGDLRTILHDYRR